jgi:hypothetical protein
VSNYARCRHGGSLVDVHAAVMSMSQSLLHRVSTWEATPFQASSRRAGVQLPHL